MGTAGRIVISDILHASRSNASVPVSAGVEGGAHDPSQAPLHLLPLAGRWLTAPSANAAEQGPRAARQRCGRVHRELNPGADLWSREGAKRRGGRASPTPEHSRVLNDQGGAHEAPPVLL